MLRQLRGEVRRLGHPVVVGTALFTVLVVAALQARAAPDPRPPAPIDVAGSARIALQHHASTLGFLLIGVAAGCTAATDARTGAMASARLAERSPTALCVRRNVAIFAVLGASLVASTLLLRATAHLGACAPGCDPASRSTGGAVLRDAAGAAVVMWFTASLASAVALATRSELLTAVLMVAIFTIPSNHLGAPAAWLVPTKWIAELMRFEPYGLGSDYTGGEASSGAGGSAAVIALVLLVSWSAVLLAVGRSLVVRRGAEGEVGGR